MAGTSLLALLDDIATVLDDVAAMTKVAVKKTAGVLGDDLALNAEQVMGVRANRELPVVWAVAKGSFRNKLILVPAALAISAVLPWLITPLLMIGGAYLCFEGAEKLHHHFANGNDKGSRKGHHKRLQAVANPEVDLVAFEERKIQGAIRTDFILSAEIIVIALGTVQEESFLVQVSVLSGIALLMTIGVYCLVAGIVKIDDLGSHLVQTGQRAVSQLGRALLWVAPRMMKTLSVVGTAAMFLVGGGIILHGLPRAEAWLHHLEHSAQGIPTTGGFFAGLLPTLLNAGAGILTGVLILFIVNLAPCLWQRK